MGKKGEVMMSASGVGLVREQVSGMPLTAMPKVAMIAFEFGKRVYFKVVSKPCSLTSIVPSDLKLK